MKITQIENARIPTEKAHGYQIVKMCEEYSSLGNKLELILPDRKNNIKEDLFEFYEIKNNFSVEFVKIPKILFKLKGKYKFKVLSFYFYFKLFFKKINSDLIITRDPVIAFISKFKKQKVFLEAHFWPERKRKIYRFLIKNVDQIICNSKGTAKKHEEAGLKNIIVAPNGVDLKKFNINKTKKELRKNLNLPEDKKIIMYVGHLYKWKGADIIVDVARELEDRKDVFFIVIGGLINDIEKYLNIVKTDSLNNLIFLGYKKREEIPQYLKSADILLLPNVPVSNESIEYTSPIKMFEYMASKVPIIASKLPSIKEILNNDNSVLVEAGNVKQIISRIEELLESENKSRIISQKAFSDVQEYTWKNRAKKILTFYDE